VRPRPDRLNSTVLSLLALGLVGIGAYGLARGHGAFGDGRAADPVLGDAVVAFVSRNADWFWPLAAAASLLVAWLGLRWLVAQVHTPSISRLSVQADGPGRTELAASGAATALAADIERYPGVRAARARITDDDPSPEVEIIVDVHDGADAVAVRRSIQEVALARFSAALEVPDVRSRVHLRLADREARAVR